MGLGDFFKKAGEGLGETIKKTGEYSKKAAEVTTLTVKATSIKEEMKKIFREVGEKAYQTYKSGASLSRRLFEEEFKKLTELEEELSRIEAEIERLKKSFKK